IRCGRGSLWALLAALAAAVPTPTPATPVAVVEADRQALVQGLQAQYEVALIRERKIADDRETQLIGTLDARLKAARAQADAAKGDARAAHAALALARADYAKLAAQIVQKDPAAQADVVAYQAQADTVAAQASPEKLAALQRFADGDRVGAWPIIQAQTEAALASASSAQQAKDLRQLAQLRGVMRAHGEATTADVLALYDRAAALDPSHFKTQAERVRLARDAGDLVRARAAATQALSVATTDGERAAAQRLVGEIATQQHDYAAAKPALEQSLAIFRRLAASDPSTANQGEVAWVLQDQGDLSLLNDAFVAARAALTESLAIRQQLAANDPSDAALQDYIGSDYQRLGDLDEKLGDLKGARADFEAGLAVRQKISAADPSNTDLQYYVSAFLRRLGDVAEKQNDLAGARKAYEDCLTIRQRLSAADPSSAQLQSAVALDLEDLASVAFDQNDMAAARADYDACLAIRRRLAEADPTNAGLQQLILRAMARSARVFGSSVSWPDVATQYSRIEKAHQLTPGDEKVLQALRYHGFSAGL
ncbi:MAG TPA: tetratricopeptide repeat protein, partial [Caulobacteraceae bacterium]|nr:tetratricopeptide repeat protein [Caulobacteraceae bacterium]